MQDPPAKVAIIGAGISAVCIALDLQRKGFDDYVIYERDDALGGTWNNNRYPGCRCDIDAILYSHSRYPNPEWKETHPPRADIQKYWQALADEHGITPHVRFSHSLVKATWNPAHSAYDLMLQTSSNLVELRHPIVVSAIGGFSTPRYPNVPGLKEYKGKVVHVSRWPAEWEDAKSLRGKEIMVVGNGCSGVQLVASLAKEPDIKVIALARSQHWVVPSPTRDQPHSEPYSKTQQVLHHIPLAYSIIWYMRAFQQDVLYFILRPSSVKFRAKQGKKFGAWMRKRAPPAIRDNIVPDFPFGAKRLIMDGGYLKALNQPNVTPLWDGLASATPDHVTTSSGQSFSPDIVALATGFDTTAGISISGRQGYVVGEDRSHTHQYLGIATPGFPNLFVMLGANTSPGINSVTTHLEVQAEYISECIVQMHMRGVKVLEVKQDATDRYNAWLDKRLEKSIWNSVKTYFRTDGGTGKVFTHFPGPVILFWWLHYGVRWDDYVGGDSMARAQRVKRSAAALGLVMVLGAVVWWMAAGRVSCL